MTASGTDAEVRAVHLSPDAPNVDVLVDDAPVISDLALTDVSDYVGLPVGSHNVKVVPAGAEEPVVIDADLELSADTTYCVLAINTLKNIQPLVLVDDNTLNPDMARIRFVHASPNAPAVDLALAEDGPVLFGKIAFGSVGDYIMVAPGTYDLEVRLAGTDEVVLPLPGIAVDGNRVYTAYAADLVGGDPALQAVISIDAFACTGDITGDGAVNLHDLLNLLGAWRSADAAADLDGNGTVNVFDLLALLAAWGQCQP